MRPDLTNRLVARHPALLAMPTGSVIAHRGIECGDGWHDLIDETLTAVEKHCVSIGSEPPRTLQIKEKLGLLRIYVRLYDDAIRSILDDAERKSAMICERCGRPGKLVSQPFLHVTCGNDRLDERVEEGVASVRSS